MSRTTLPGRRLVTGLLVAATMGTLLVGVTATPASAVPRAVSDFSYGYAGGTTVTLAAPAATIAVSGNAGYLTVSINTEDESWGVDLAAPRDDTLRPGVYSGAERAAFRTGRAPGLDVFGNGSGCNEVYGQFTIDQIEVGADGAVTVLDARYSRRCESAAATPLTGRVRYQAYPLSYRFISDVGDYIGQGVTKSYTNSTTVFTFLGNREGAHFDVSGRRDWWNISLAAPVGQELAVGTYTGAVRFADAASPGLNVSGNGRGCNQITGSFTIRDMAHNAEGEMTALWATFEQHCEGGAPALRGTIRYYA